MQADVAVLVVDASEGATDQDAAIAGEADKAGCGIVVAANYLGDVGAHIAKCLWWYLDHLTDRTDFADLARATQASANELYGRGSTQARQRRPRPTKRPARRRRSPRRRQQRSR